MDFSCYEYKNKYLQNQKTPINNYEGYKVVGAGIEPARTLVHSILSAACLPVPPSNQLVRPTGIEPVTH